MSSLENLTLELKIICATNITHTNATDKIDVYAVVSLNLDDNSQIQAAKTPIDYDGGSNPTWNHPVKFSVSEKQAHEGLLSVNVKLYSYWLEGSVDLEIGEVNVSVQELLTSNPPSPLTNGNGDKMKLITRPVKEAILSLSYRFKREVASNTNMYPSLSDSSSSGRYPNRDYSSSFRYPNNDLGRSCRHAVDPPIVQTPMTKLVLELVIKSTKDIKDNSWIHGMDMYASATVREGKLVNHRSNTHIVYAVHKNPIWDHPIRFTLNEPLAREGKLTFFVQIICHRTIRGDKEIGIVEVPILQLLGSYPPSTLTSDMKLVTRDVIHKTRKIGTLNFMYKFLNEQATIPPAPSQHNTIPPAQPQNVEVSSALPTTTPQPFIMMYIPASHPGTGNGLHGEYQPFLFGQPK
ncbi:unnamed protein product [Cochlearia groenlandica]